jgi:hypothetical protein
MFYKRVPKLYDAQMRQRVFEYLLNITRENGLDAGEVVFLRCEGPEGLFLELEHSILQEPIRHIVARWGHSGTYAFAYCLGYNVDTQRVIGEDEEQVQDQPATVHDLVTALSELEGTWTLVQPARG